MNKFCVDYQQLDHTLKQEKVFRLAEVKDRLVKVAFDVVRFIDSDNIDGLWQIRQSSDGEFIVAMYSEPEEVKTAASKSSWSVIKTASADRLHIFYQETPITSLSAEKLGLSAQEMEVAASSLPEKLAASPLFVKHLLEEVSATDRRTLLAEHPELQTVMSQAS